MAHSSPPLNTQPSESRTLKRPASQSRLTQLLVPGRSRSGSTTSQASVNIEDSGSSGRATPEGRTRIGKAAAASLLANDSKYKRFKQQVDKALQSFESINEWADFISFLSRLLKTLQTPSPPYHEIPRKLIVSKRLAQCLNPALPSGVHQRALDVYSYIFSIIGTDGLQRDLAIWSSGLFPFFQYAATSVRPLLINIYETYYLPLGENLRPATKAFVLALLPGMEEEAGDFFDKILFLLDRLSGAISPSFFLQSVFLILITSPVSRLAALNYLARRMTKPPDHPDATIETGLLVRGLGAALDDENILVRRNALDLLLRVLKLESKILKEAELSDKQLLTNSVTSVVLQKELSLSRRVYNWLLGTSEAPNDQIEYFKTYGLDLLSSTLLLKMENAMVEGDEGRDNDQQKPFKIFLSLLDKWEVGGVLSERVAIPALRIIMDASTSGLTETSSMASALYEAVEPSIIWKALYYSVEERIVQGNKGDVALVSWLLDNVPQKDEEIAALHLPLLLDRILELIECDNIAADHLPEALRLAVSLVQHIPATVFSKSSSTFHRLHTEDPPLSQVLYEQKQHPLDIEIRLHTQLLPHIVQSAFSISIGALKGSDPTILLHALNIISVLIDYEAPALEEVDGPIWLNAMVDSLSRVKAFVVVEALVMVTLKASRSDLMKSGIAVTSDKTMSAILDSLFRYLQPSASLYHSRAVELLWDYNQLAEIHTLENVIAGRMTKSPTVDSAFEAFGIFWRLTDDSMLPGEIFHVPICIVLESLKSTDPDVQRQAETWLRLNLRSYFRILDPLLSRLLDPSIKYDSTQGTYDGLVDLNLIRHQIECVTALFQFGGQGLCKACQAEELNGSLYPTFISRAENGFPGVKGYMELICLLLVRFVEAEASPQMGRKVSPLILRVQSAALSLLQMIVSRGEVSQPLISSLKTTLANKLLSAVQARRLTLQSKMLHLLHSAINASSSRREPPSHVPSQAHRRGTSSATEKRPSVDVTVSDFEHQLVATVMQGVATPSNIPILQHWIDFVLMTVPLLVNRPNLLHTLAECFSQETRELVQRIQEGHGKQSSLQGGKDTIVILDEELNVTDAEVIMTLNALERVLTILSNPTSGKIDDSVSGQGESGSRILGLVSTVFTVEAPSNESKPEPPRYLDDAVHALLVTWSATLQASEAGDERARAENSHQTYVNIRGRTRKVLEKVFRASPLSVISSCVHVWSLRSEQVSDVAIFDCVDTLTPSAQNVVELVCDLVSGKSGKAFSDYRADPSYLAFLEAYVSRLEAPIAVQVWSTLFGFARELVSTTTTAFTRSHLYSLLQCLNDLSLTILNTTALEDRRLRRDFQDTYAKALDLVVNNSLKIAEAGIWDRPDITKHVESNKKDDVDVEKGLVKIYDYLATAVIPNLRLLLIEPDRVNSACSGIIVAIVNPAFRRQRIDAPILRLVLEISRISCTTKTWRPLVADFFGDHRLFKSKPSIETDYWKQLILALFTSDKERFPDLLSRITSTSSANINIFTNREQEMAGKCGNLRRLSLILLAAERNHYLGLLPAIQERLVEMLRSGNVSARVHSEVYLCLRVLMCRISPQHLTNFWPVILAELLRIFEQTLEELPEDGSEELLLILAACKFLDLLLVIQSEDFQIHQWMFVTDTTDAAYPPEEYTPDAMMDRLAELLTELGSRGGDTEASPSEPSLVLTSPINRLPKSLRRPRLSEVTSIASLQQLQTFFARASMDTFESVYAEAAVDWNGIEEGLLGEIFDA
ncbi:hypothetical protein I314_06101 [Cryptococcus bacillisporus CA1873]|uniref:Dopey N-terminal domain-containing protein n=1 Tax=Cryptococcus bacillisporus CA1873 TaxID=1296111 RepID=A0ABR5B3G5_CRYGA|nr:hypothetical protein I314_06101 [Cryptococcus bacillisporus CA1873]|eukprot:KIR58136.1 hypothetical protein I314_06101 [Cryptococcus gattii CA1873]